jgi:UDP-glucose 4-epimerase
MRRVDGLADHIATIAFPGVDDVRLHTVGSRLLSIMLTMKRCMVTGANGFIGSALCARLERLGVEVVRLSRTAASPNALKIDLGRERVPSLIGAPPDAVFHLAGRVHQFDAGKEAELEHNRGTIEGTRGLVAAAIEAGVKSFVFFSTCAVMPRGIDRALDEQVEIHPTTPYGRAKLTAERLVLSANGAGGIRTVCLRLPAVYGPGHKGELKRMIDAMSRHAFPPIPELGGSRSFVHVDDVVDAALLVATSEAASGKVYIVAEERTYTSRQIYDIIIQALGRRSPGWYVPKVLLGATAKSGDLVELVTRRRAPFDSDMLARLSQPARYSSALIQRELGFRAKRSLADSATDLVASATR